MAALNPTESQIQIAYFDWVRFKERSDPRYGYIIKVPNETRGNYGWMRKLLKEGLAKGFPDVICLWPMPPFSGLVIEFKRKGGKTSKEQDAWLDKLHTAKWCPMVVHSFEMAKTVTESYFEFAKESRGK